MFPCIPTSGESQNAQMHQGMSICSNMMRENTDGLCKIAHCSLPFMDSTHECITSLDLGQLFFCAFLPQAPEYALSATLVANLF
jgi:hypothetical protein